MLHASERIFAIDRFSLRRVISSCGVGQRGLSIICGTIGPVFRRVKSGILGTRGCLFTISDVGRGGGFKVTIGTFGVMRGRVPSLGLCVVKSVGTSDFEGVKRLVSRYGGSIGVGLLKHISSDSLVHCCDGTVTFVFPSLCRKFKVPILRTRTYKYPIISSGSDSLPRVLNGDTLVYGPGDSRRFTNTVVGLIGRRSVGRRLINGKCRGMGHFS